MLSRVFVARPISAAVLSILIVLAGLAAMLNLPVAMYPEIAPPVISVKALYPGASAEVIGQTVAAPLESQISGVEGMLYMNSSSASNGLLEIRVTFEIGSDADLAAQNINNRVKQAESRLPEEVRRQGITVEKISSSFLQVLAFDSPDGRLDDLFTSNFVTLQVLDRLKAIPGATGVQIFGAKDYAMRIWVDPDRLTQLGLTVAEIALAVRAQNAQFAPGKIGQPPIGEGQQLVYSITTRGRLSTPEEFGAIVVRARPDQSVVRLRDVARVELGSKDYDFIGRVDDNQATLVGIFLQPGSNALAVGAEVERTIDELRKGFPPGLRCRVTYDTTRFVRVSIREVLWTLLEAMVLVFLVVFVFLQNLRATLIPTLAVPVSLIGTFAGLLLFGYSINTLTLFGMVLAIGIVVDDAIVVLENVERIMHEKHLNAREATLEAMHEVTGPVIAIALVLIGAFVPIAFLGGLAGALYRQFAVTISIAVAISGFVALTLTPALCASILDRESKSTLRVFRWFDTGFSGLTWLYTKSVSGLLRVSVLGALLFLGMVAATGWLWNKTPGSLVPKEDQGYYIAALYLPDGSSLQRTDAFVKQVTALIKSNPANEHVTAFAGMDFIGGGFKNNAATMFVTQTHWDGRKATVDELLAEITAQTDGLGEGKVLVFGPAPIFGIGQSGGFELFLQDRTDAGTKRLAEVAQDFVGELGKAPGLMYAVTFWRSAAPQLYVDVDRERAALLGVSLSDAFDTLSATLGTFYVNDFTKFGRNWQVLMSAAEAHRKAPEDVGRIRVRSSRGEMLPLSAFADVRYSSGPETLDRHGNLPAVKLFGSGLPGVSTGDALRIVDAVAAKALPPGYSIEWIEASFQEKRSAGTSSLALVMAAILMFLVLAAQYERWTLPLSVLLALPFGTFGALLAVWLRGFTNDVYFQIGLVTLLGLAAKNAILIVEFAVQRMNAGLSKREAILEAARLRFRPILMTSLAFILGVLPLALSHGAGAGARQSVGTGVLGGMLSATFLAIFFVPLFVSWIGGRPKAGKP